MGVDEYEERIIGIRMTLTNTFIEVLMNNTSYHYIMAYYNMVVEYIAKC